MTMRRIRRLASVLALLFGAGCTTLSELRNPIVSIPIDRPPGIGIALTKVVFAPPEGNCSAQLANAATRELLANDVEVGGDLIVVATRGTAAGEDVPAGGVPGKILLSLSDTACEGERIPSSRRETRKRTKTREVDGEEEEYEEEYTVTYYTRSTRFDVGVSVRASDLDTGEVVTAWETRHSAADSNTEVDDIPEYPSESTLKRSALVDAGNELGQWLLPWTEELDLIFYDADECGMAATYAHFEAGDMAAAAAAARRSIKDCTSTGADPRFRAAAYYNAGLLHFFDGRHDAALEMFDIAGTLDPENGKIASASAETYRARASLEEILRIDALAAAASAPDLVFASLSVDRADAASGATLRLAAAVRNDGGGRSTATTLRWYRLRDGGDAAPQDEIGRAEVAAMEPGGTSGQAIDVPVGGAGGGYRACIDAVDGESDTAPNCSDVLLDAGINAARQTLPDPGGRGYVVDSPVVEDDRSPGFALDAANENPQGVAYAGGRVYVVDDRNRKIYAHTTAGVRDPGADFGLDDQKVPTGIAVADRRLYVVDWSDDKVYVYTTAGGRDPDADFDLASTNGSPTGVAHADGRLYVVDSSDDKVYVYTTAGGRDAVAEFGLDPANRSAAGIAHAGGRLHVVDDLDGKVYVYTTSGTRDPDADFVLERDETPRGIAGADGVFLVVDSGGNRVRAYVEQGSGP